MGGVLRKKGVSGCILTHCGRHFVIDNFTRASSTIMISFEDDHVDRFNEKKAKIVWGLQINPAGDFQSDRSFISVFLYANVNYSPHPVQTVTVSLAILGPDGSLYNKMSKSTVIVKGYQSWEFSQFISWEDLQSTHRGNILLYSESEQKLTLHLEINADKNTESSFTSPNVYQALEQIFKEKIFPDFTLIAEDDHFSVHKAVLAARSPYFRNFFNKLSKHINQMQLTDTRSDVLRQILLFIYTDKITFHSDILKDVLSIAGRFSLFHLKHLCTVQLIQELDATNAIEYLVIADKTNAELLKELCTSQIIKHLSYLSETEEMKNLREKHANLFEEIFSKFGDSKHYTL